MELRTDESFILDVLSSIAGGLAFATGVGLGAGALSGVAFIEGTFFSQTESGRDNFGAFVRRDQQNSGAIGIAENSCSVSSWECRSPCPSANNLNSSIIIPDVIPAAAMSRA